MPYIYTEAPKSYLDEHNGKIQGSAKTLLDN